MLENSVWRQYHKENNLREELCSLYGVEPLTIIDDEKELYAVLKRKLTKKELKLYAMDSAGISNEAMKKEFSLDDEGLLVAKNKLYKKMKQDKLRYSFQASAKKSDADFE
ncbi:hypothetical protein KKG72_02980 [bacterium]|nr:hypothetical protein [bacterium]MBU1994150.1 hypothetical protein [bacterium]